jgi:hypothetical protein
MVTQKNTHGYGWKHGGIGEQKMWQINEPYYSDKTKLKMLKEASTEKLMEYLLMVTRRAEDGK